MFELVGFRLSRGAESADVRCGCHGVTALRSANCPAEVTSALTGAGRHCGNWQRSLQVVLLEPPPFPLRPPLAGISCAMQLLFS